MGHRTDTLDLREALAGHNPPPSYAAQILIVTAHILDGDAITPINAWLLDDALTTAEAAIPSDGNGRLAARAALPLFAGASLSTYADRLRLAARSL